MSTARSADEDADPAATAAALRDATFVKVVARADGDAVAASGILARALRRRGVPFQIRTSADPVPSSDDDAVTVAVGARTGDVSLPGTTRPASVVAFEVARELDVEPHPVLGLAGVVAAGSTVGADGSGTMLDAAERTDRVVRRPGVAVPTGDLSDGLAHATLLTAPWSGDVEAVRALLASLDLPADLDATAHRRLASVVALDAATADGTTARAAASVERALRPYATPAGPFATVGGFADVLDCAARERPGTAVALALGHGATAGDADAGAGDADAADGTPARSASVANATRTAALDAWRDHARAAHRALREATTGRYDGAFVARVDADASTAALPTVARLLRDFRSPEPVAVVVADGHAAAASVDARGLGAAVSEAAAACDGTGYGTPTTGEARFEGEAQQFITALREAL